MTALASSEAGHKRAERRTFGVAAGAHALHDGYTDLIYVMLPVWQAEFGLSYAAIGALRGLFAGNTLDQAGAKKLVDEKTAALQAGSPEVIAAAADFFDNLRPEQQQKVRDFMERGRRWGHRG